MDYQRTAKEYASLYRRNERTIKRWKAKGWPLDDEAATRALIVTIGRDAGGDIGQPPAGTTAGAASPRLPASGERGLKAAIERLRQSEVETHAGYQAAIQAQNEALAGKRLKEWNQIIEQLRKVEGSSPEIEEANRNSVSLSDLRLELTEMFARLRQDLDGLPRRVAGELAGADEITVRQVLTRETGELISNLYGCKYLKGGGSES